MPLEGENIGDPLDPLPYTGKGKNAEKTKSDQCTAVCNKNKLLFSLFLKGILAQKAL